MTRPFKKTIQVSAKQKKITQPQQRQKEIQNQNNEMLSSAISLADYFFKWMTKLEDENIQKNKIFIMPQHRAL